jgi:hypothetical protein
MKWADARPLRGSRQHALFEFLLGFRWHLLASSRQTERHGDLDFDAINISNVEAINLGVNDNNNNGVALSLADILSLAATSSGTGLSANGDNIDLFVFGDNEGAVVDNVTLTGGWTANGTITTADVTGANTTFTLYVAGTSQIAVQQDLDVAAA